MADVIDKIINSAEIRNNAIVVGGMQGGNYSTFTRGINENTHLSGIEAKLTNRFDDPDPVQL